MILYAWIRRQKQIQAKILTANSLSSCAILSSRARISLELGVSVRVSPVGIDLEE